MSYAEDILVPAGVSLDGRWDATGSTWARTGPRATVVNTGLAGVRFAAGVTRASSFDGFLVRPAQLSGAKVAGITVLGGSPVLRDFEVTPIAASMTAPLMSVGVEVASGGFPKLEGTSTNRSTVTAGTGASSSVALLVDQARVEVTFVNFTAGSAGTATFGARLLNGGGSTFHSAAFSGGAAQQCYGFLSEGPADGTLVEESTATGCPRVTTTSTPLVGVGLAFDDCGAGVSLAPPTVRQVVASGGAVSGANSLAVGAAALNGCPVRFLAGSVFSGATAVPTGALTKPDTAIGLTCSFRDHTLSAGADSACVVRGNTISAGSVGASTSYGLRCEGSCASGGANCQGSCLEVAENVILAEAGNERVHLHVSQGSPSITRNRIGQQLLSSTTPSCPATSSVVGLELVGSSSRVTNNFIVGGPCATAVGVQYTIARRSDGSTPSATLNSNSILPTAPATTGFVGTSSVGVRLSLQSTVSLTPAKSGIWRNNIITAGPSTSPQPSTWAFQETLAVVDPIELSNNLFMVYSNTPTMSDPLYLNEGSVTLSTAAAINAMGDVTAAGNITGLPGFASTATGDLHINATSAARGAGTSTGAPLDDIDGDARPNPAGSQPDIGADEVP